MRRVILGCVIGALLQGSAMTQQVEFPLDYYSFEEIARRMSVDGRRVDCARSLSQKLALVRLKPRSWQQAREILEAGLDIRFRLTSEAENRWILERNPEVARREKRWREQLAAYLEQKRDREWRLMRKIVDKRVSDEEAIATALEIFTEDAPDGKVSPEFESEMRLIIELLRTMPLEPALRSWRAFHRYEQQQNEFLKNNHGAFDPNEPFRWYVQFEVQYPLSSFGFAQEVLDWAQSVASDKKNKFYSFFPSSGEHDEENPQILRHFALNLLWDSARQYGELWARDALKQQLQPPLSVLETIEQGAVLREYIVTLPPDQLAWHLNDVEGKLVPFDSRAPVPTQLLARATWRWNRFGMDIEFVEAQDVSSFSRNMSTLSDYIYLIRRRGSLRHTLERVSSELARAYDAALERDNQLIQQSPVNQPLQPPLPAEASVADLVRRWAQEHKQEVVMEVLHPLIEEFEDSSASLEGRLKTFEPPCLLNQRDGVWFVQYSMAFLDRVSDVPYVAIRDLMRSDWSYEAWRRFYTAVSAEQARWLMIVDRFLSWNPRETPESQAVLASSVDLGIAWLVMAILESLPPDVRMQFWNPSTDAPTLTLAQLPFETRARLLSILTLWRALLIENSYGGLPRRERLMPPSAWLERLRLTHTKKGWALHLIPDEPSREDDKNRLFIISPLPGKPPLYLPESDI